VTNHADRLSGGVVTDARLSAPVPTPGERELTGGNPLVDRVPNRVACWDVDFDRACARCGASDRTATLRCIDGDLSTRVDLCRDCLWEAILALEAVGRFRPRSAGRGPVRLGD
jgi:hypothetical protein